MWLRPFYFANKFCGSGTWGSLSCLFHIKSTREHWGGKFYFQTIFLSHGWSLDVLCFLSCSTCCFILSGLGTACGLLNSWSFNEITLLIQCQWDFQQDSANKSKGPTCSEYQIIKEFLLSVSQLLIISNTASKMQKLHFQALIQSYLKLKWCHSQKYPSRFKIWEDSKWQIHTHLHYSKCSGNGTILDT